MINCRHLAWFIFYSWPFKSRPRDRVGMLQFKTNITYGTSNTFENCSLGPKWEWQTFEHFNGYPRKMLVCAAPGKWQLFSMSATWHKLNFAINCNTTGHFLVFVSAMKIHSLSIWRHTKVALNFIHRMTQKLQKHLWKLQVNSGQTIEKVFQFVSQDENIVNKIRNGEN